MIGKLKCVLAFTILFWSRFDVDGHAGDYHLLFKDNSPVTTGSNVTLNATIVDNKGFCYETDKTLIFKYTDDRHAFEQKTIKNCVALFTIPFEDTLKESIYSYTVKVLMELLPIPILTPEIAFGSGKLVTTENLNGQLLLLQNNTNIIKPSPQTTYVSSSLETLHKVELNTPDFDYLNKSNSLITVYWFVDCVYKANTTNFTFSINYTQPNVEHEVLGIVVASIPNNKTTPSTTTPPTPSTPTTPIPSVTNTTVSPNINSAITVSTPSTNISTSTVAVTVPTSTMITSTPHSKMDDKPSRFVINSNYSTECQNTKYSDLLVSAVHVENIRKYGYFSQNLFVKDPINNVKTQGKVWIQEGEMLNLQVSCNGSGPFRYCAHYVLGPYNVSGNEVCQLEKNLVQCDMNFFHYLRDPTNYTLVVITSNDVSKVVTPIGINIYKVKKQPQISVIVVPVTFSSIAVIIIVFGIAYYFQNRSRYMVEVADFDFANNSDMEYKTFRERLRDAISQAINRTQEYSEYDGSEEHIGSLAAPQNQKYGSMQ